VSLRESGMKRAAAEEALGTIRRHWNQSRVCCKFAVCGVSHERACRESRRNMSEIIQIRIILTRNR